MSKKKSTEKDLVSLLATGNFTIVYWDSEVPTFYKGKWDIHKEYEKDEYKTMNKSEIDIDQSNMDGYCPDVVRWLAMALKGKTDSI